MLAALNTGGNQVFELDETYKKRFWEGNFFRVVIHGTTLLFKTTKPNILSYNIILLFILK